MGEFEFMDMLFNRYACPIEFMKIYIEQGRFGEFVKEIIQLDSKRQSEESEKEEEQKLWDLYLHCMSDKSFADWKKEIQKQDQPAKQSMTNDQVDATINNSRQILKSFSPK